MFKNIFFFIVLMFAFSACLAQEEWKLKTDNSDIKTYSKRVADSKINAVKIESVFPVSVTQFVAVLLDIDSYGKWIYNCKSASLLKQPSASELYYYSEVTFPWPCANRDFVSHMHLRQDSQTRIVTVEATNVPG